MKRIPAPSNLFWTSAANSLSNMPSRICGSSSMTETSNPRPLNATAVSKPTNLAPTTTADSAVSQFLKISLPSSGVLIPYTPSNVCPRTGIMKESAPVASIKESQPIRSSPPSLFTTVTSFEEESTPVTLTSMSISIFIIS